MTAKGFILAFISWLTFAFLDSLISGVFVGESNINTIVNVDFIAWKDFLFIPIPTPNLAYLNAMWALATWDFFFFSADAGFWIRFFIGLTFMAALVWAVYTIFLPIFINLTASIGSVIRSINPFGSS